MFVLAQEATVSVASVLAWVAGIAGTLLSALLVAAFTFAWRADKQLGIIVAVLKGLRSDIHDHEDRIRAIEGRPSRADDRSRNKEAMLES